jgi:DNA replicative helicase MCM subunit Mcm2 (Cdc46/Mcm family)
MAEASAKMHLREYVRADDVDLAISVAVGSFLSAQKLSVKRTLERVSSDSPYPVEGWNQQLTQLKHNRVSANTYRMLRIMKSY